MKETLQERAPGYGFATLTAYETESWLSRPIAFLATTNSLGGLERLAVRLCAELHERGADMRFICPPYSPLSNKCSELGIEQCPLTIRNSADLCAAKTLADYIVQENIGILHVHSRRDYVPAVAAIKLAARQMRRKPKLVLHVHQIRRLGDGGKWADHFFNWGADKVLTVSGAVKAEVCKDSVLKSSLVDILMNGVDAGAFEGPGTRQRERWRMEMLKAWGISPSAKVIGMVGRLNQKGQPFVVDQIPEILKHVPDAQFVMVGPVDCPSTMAYFETATAALGVTDRVIFTGNIQNMPAAYAAMDVLVHLPTDEAFGLAVAEAMASALPVIVSRIGGCPELVQHKTTGLLIESGDKDALIDSIVKLLGDDSSHLSQSMGAAARKSVEDHFTIDRQVDELIDIYTDLLPTLA